MSAIVDATRRKLKPARFLPPQSQGAVDLESIARSGDRPSKADSGDYWEQLYADIERRNGKDGKSIAALFSEWLQLWCEEKEWHRRWIVLSEFAKSELGDAATPDTIRVRMGRFLGRLQKDKGFCERFHLIPRSDSPPESGSRETVIPDVLPEDPASDDSEPPSDAQA